MRINIKRYVSVLLAMILFSVTLSSVKAEPITEKATAVKAESTLTDDGAALETTEDSITKSIIEMPLADENETETDPESIVLSPRSGLTGLDGEISAEELAQTTVEIEQPEAGDCITPAIEGDGARQNYYRYLINQAKYARDIEIGSQDHIVLLSTCYLDVTNGRHILLGRITDRVEENTLQEVKEMFINDHHSDLEASQTGGGRR